MDAGRVDGGASPDGGSQADGGASGDGGIPGDGGTAPMDFGTAIAAVGCSNTRQAVEGYLQVSSQDRFINTAQGGQAMREWSQPSGGPWDLYESMRPASGYSAVWLNLCQRAADGLDQSVVDTVIANIRARDPNAPIVISPLNFYVEESCSRTNGNEIPNAGAALADATAANDPGVFRGPDLGPLGPALLRSDHCHLNTAGITFVGQQMRRYFDTP